MKRKVNLVEQPGGKWLWLEMGQTFKTAGGAAKGIRKDDQLLAKFHQVVVSEITWHPRTVLGKMLAEVLSGKEIT